MDKIDIIQKYLGIMKENRTRMDQIIRENGITNLDKGNPLVRLEEVNPVAYKIWDKLFEENEKLSDKITALMNDKNKGFDSFR